MEKKFKIAGMHCASCASGIQTFLRTQEGVESAEVDFETETATIEFTEDADLEGIKEQVEQMGYKLKKASAS